MRARAVMYAALFTAAVEASLQAYNEGKAAASCGHPSEVTFSSPLAALYKLSG
jgi:hypothetical protein